MSVSEMALSLYAINNNAYDGIAVNKALSFEAGFISYAKTNAKDVVERIQSTGDLSKDDEQVVAKVLQEFKSTFTL